MANFCCCRFVCKYGSVSLRRNETKKKKKKHGPSHTHARIFTLHAFYRIQLFCLIFSVFISFQSVVSYFLIFSCSGRAMVSSTCNSNDFHFCSGHSLCLSYTHTKTHTFYIQTTNQPHTGKQQNITLLNAANLIIRIIYILIYV